MIGKIVKGGGFRGALNYDLQESKGRMLDTNMAGENERELAKEFGQIRKLRPQLGKAVLHVSLSAAPGEHLSDEQWREIGHKYLRGMGFGKSQFVMTRHNDTDHEHIHIIANRIRLDGSVVSDGMDFKRQETLMREIERSYGLQRVEPSENAERKAPTKGEIESYVRTGVPSTRTELQQLCDAAAKESQSISDYVRHLERFGVDVIPTTQKEGAKLSGLQYRKDGVVMKGSDLGKSYSPAGLAKRGISYEQDRDDAAVRRCQQREAGRGIGTAHEGVGQHGDAERQAISRDAGAIGAGHGELDRGNAKDAGGHTRPVSERGAGLQLEKRTGHEAHRKDGNSGERGIERDHQRIEQLRVGSVFLGDGVGRDYGGAHQRIVSLGDAAAADRAGREAGSGATQTRRDRSLEAVQRQVKAMGLESFEVAVIDPKTQQSVMSFNSTPNTVQYLMPTLKRENARGKEIFLKPTGNHSIAILDKIDPRKLDLLRNDDLQPALVVEAANRESYAVIKLSDQPLDKATRTVSAQYLATVYGSDRDTAMGSNYVRMAGFTDQRSSEDTKPYVLAFQGQEAVPRGSRVALAHAKGVIDDFKEQQRRQAEIEAKRKAAEKAKQEAEAARKAAVQRDVIKAPRSDRGRGMSR